VERTLLSVAFDFGFDFDFDLDLGFDLDPCLHPYDSSSAPSPAAQQINMQDIFPIAIA
jgi:hypothetical protein